MKITIEKDNVEKSKADSFIEIYVNNNLVECDKLHTELHSNIDIKKGDLVKVKYRFAEKYSLHEAFFSYLVHTIFFPIFWLFPNKSFFQLCQLAAYNTDWVFTEFQVEDTNKAVELILVNATSKFPLFLFKGKNEDTKIRNYTFRPDFKAQFKRQTKYILRWSILPTWLNAGVLYAISTMFGGTIKYIILAIGLVSMMSLLTFVRITVCNAFQAKKFNKIIELKNIGVVEGTYVDSQIIPIRFKQRQEHKDGLRTIKIAGVSSNEDGDIPVADKLYLEVYGDGKLLCTKRYIPAAYNYFYIEKDIKKIEVKCRMDENEDMSGVATCLSGFVSVFAPWKRYKGACIMTAMLPNEMSLNVEKPTENDTIEISLADFKKEAYKRISRDSSLMKRYKKYVLISSAVVLAIIIALGILIPETYILGIPLRTVILAVIPVLRAFRSINGSNMQIRKWEKI